MVSWGRNPSHYPRIRHALESTDISLGSRPFRRAIVDCTLLSRKSNWGKLHQQPAGILMLDLTLSQPFGQKLNHVDLRLSFLEENENGGFVTSSSLNVTEYIAPLILCGPPIEQKDSLETQLQPAVGADGLFTISGIGYKSTKETLRKCHWILKSHRLPNEHGMYTQAQWLWEANPLNKQIETVGTFHVGVTIQHGGRPFFVHLDIGGRLRRTPGSSRRFQLEKKHGIAHTKIYPKASETDIEQEVNCLRGTIEEANSVSVHCTYAKYSRLSSVPESRYELYKTLTLALAIDEPKGPQEVQAERQPAF